MSRSIVENLTEVARFASCGKHERKKGTGKCIGCHKLLPKELFPLECIQRNPWNPPRALCPDCLPKWVDIHRQWLVAKELMQR